MVTLPNLDSLLDLYIDVGRGESCYGMTLIELSELFEESYKSLTSEEMIELKQMIRNYHKQNS